jgi:hypothetical protein
LIQIVPPTLFTSTSIRPWAATACLMSSLRAGERARSTSTFVASTPCSLQLGHGLRRARLDAVGDDDGAALGAEPSSPRRGRCPARRR